MRFDISAVTPAIVLTFLGALLLLLPLLVLFSEWIKRTRSRNTALAMTAPPTRKPAPKPKPESEPRPPLRQNVVAQPLPPPPLVYKSRPIAPPPLPEPASKPIPPPPPEPPPPAPATETTQALVETSPDPAAVTKPPVWWLGAGGISNEPQPGSTPAPDQPPQRMRYRRLGKTGMIVSEIGMGTWGMGGMWGLVNDREAIRSIHRAMDLGLNFIDTALAYGDGHAEELIGTALKERPEPVYIATKVPPKNMQWPANHDTPAAEVFPDAWIIACAEVSLRHLRRERLDLLQLHVWAPRWLHERDVWLPAIERLKKDGKIQSFGISINDCQPDTALEAVASGLVDTVQVIHNIFEQSPEDKLFPACQQHNVGVIARSPLDEGGLTGSLTPDTVFHPDDWRKVYFKGERLRETVERAEKLRFLLREEITTLSQAALKFCLSHPAVSTVIPGMRRVTHVQENCAISDGRPLTGGELKLLRDHAWPRNFYVGA